MRKWSLKCIIDIWHLYGNALNLIHRTVTISSEDVFALKQTKAGDKKKSAFT